MTLWCRFSSDPEPSFCHSGYTHPTRLPAAQNPWPSCYQTRKFCVPFITDMRCAFSWGEKVSRCRGREVHVFEEAGLLAPKSKPKRIETLNPCPQAPGERMTSDLGLGHAKVKKAWPCSPKRHCFYLKTPLDTVSWPLDKIYKSGSQPCLHVRIQAASQIH